MKNIWLRVLAWLPAIAVMAGIFLFSAETGDESAATSGRFTTLVANALLDEDATEEVRTAMTARVSFIVRKGAHFSIYALLGACTCFAMQFQPVMPRWRYGIAFVVSALYAATDEWHQSFVPGRSGNMRDVLIDASGVLFGLFLFWCVRALIARRRARAASR